MDLYIARAIAYLDRLVGFKTLSALPNLDMVNFIIEQLARDGVACHVSYDESGNRANLHALIGPEVAGGVVLNGHTDVVPVDGQDWSGDPFVLSNRDGRLYGRGAVDMKAFLACMFAAVPMWQKKALKKPVHICVCYDEEIGGFGAPGLVADMCQKVPRPAIAIVGEPTGMQIVTAHKGGFEMRTIITGQEAHSSDPRMGVNAIFYATRFIAYLDEMAKRLAETPDEDSRFEPNYTTINVGTIKGGVARNTVAGHCTFDWEMRPLPSTDGKQLIAQINEFAMTTLLREMRAISPTADIRIEMQADVPALGPRQAAPAVAFIANITGCNATHGVSFGTDAGHFAAADISTVVMGPGCIEQAHKPDEFIEISQIEKCLRFFDKLGDELARS